MTLEHAKALREQRAAAIAKMQTITAKAGEEKRRFSAEEKASFDTLHTEAEECRETYERLETEARASLESQQVQEQIERQEHANRGNDKIPTREERDLAFRAQNLSARHRDGINGDWKAAVDKCGLTLDASPEFSRTVNLSKYAPRMTLEQLRDQSQDLTYRATTAQSLAAAKGGNTTDDELIRQIEVQLKAFGGVRNVARVIRTSHGNTLNIPTADDTGNVATVLAINTAAGIKDLTFGQVSFTAHKYTSGVVLVPIELLQDTAVDLVGYIGEALGTRVARGTNAHFTTGTTGGSTPAGIVTRSDSAVTVAATTALAYGDLRDLEHSVDPAYRMGAGFMFNDAILKIIEKMLDNNGNPIFRPGGPNGSGDRLFNKYPVTINQDMSTGGASAKIALFGDFSKYVVRDAMPVDLLVLRERFAEVGQVAWLTFSRHDGDVIFATTTNARKPIRALTDAST